MSELPDLNFPATNSTIIVDILSIIFLNFLGPKTYSSLLMTV